MRLSKPFVAASALALCLVTLLGGCGTELDARGETLRILATGLEPAYLNEDYRGDIRVVGGLSPYTFQLSSGTLPPGLTLQGGSVRGVPTEEGEYSFTITVSDAQLSKTFQEYNLRVELPPPAELTLNVPDTDIQRQVVLRGEVSNARSLQALRSLVTWNPELFEYVPDSARSASENVILFSEAGEGRLALDLAVLGGTVSGERRMFEFVLRPLQVTTLELRSETEFLSDVGGHGYRELTEGIGSALEDEVDDLLEDDPLLDNPDTTDPDNDPDNVDEGDL